MSHCCHPLIIDPKKPKKSSPKWLPLQNPVLSQRLNLMMHTDLKRKSCPPHVQTITNSYVISLLAPNANTKILTPNHIPKQRHHAYNYWEPLASPPKKRCPSETTSKFHPKNSTSLNSTSQHTCPLLAPIPQGKDQHTPLLTAPKHPWTTPCFTQMPSPHQHS